MAIVSSTFSDNGSSVNSTRSRVSSLQAAWQQGEVRFADLRARQIRNFNYVVGKMLDPRIKAKLIEDKRPVYEFQLPKPNVVWLAGKLKRDATKMKAIPIHRGAEDGAFLHTVLVNDWAMEQCSGYNEIARAGLDAFIGVFGAVNNYWSLQEDPEGLHITESIDPTAVGFDPECRQIISQRDMRYVWYSKMMAVDEIIEVYKKYLDDETIAQMRRRAEEMEGYYRQGDENRSGIPRSWADRNQSVTTTTWDTNQRERQKTGVINTFSDARSGLYRFIEWHDKRYTYRKWVYSPTDQNVPWQEVPQDKINDIDHIRNMMTSTRKADNGIEDIPNFRNPMVHEESQQECWITVIVPALLPDKPILEQSYKIQKRGFAIRIIPCYDFHPDTMEMQSDVDSMVAVCDSFNQHMMTMHETTMDMVNPSYDYPEGSIQPQDKKDWESKTRGLLRRFRPVAGMKPEPRRPQTEAFRALQAQSEAEEHLQEKIGGISPSAKGLAQGAREANALAQARAQKAEVMISHFIDNIQESMKYIFRYVDRELQQFLTFTREVRILGDTDDPQWLTLNAKTLDGVKNDVTAGEYDFKPDQQALGESARKDNFATLVQLAQLAQGDPIVMLLMMGEIFKNADFPNAKKMAGYIDEKIQYMVQAEQEQHALQEGQAKLAMIGQTIATHRALNPPPQDAMDQAQERVAANA